MPKFHEVNVFERNLLYNTIINVNFLSVTNITQTKELLENELYCIEKESK